MKVETARFVGDRYEWSSLARRAPSVYHRWEWSEQSRRRVTRFCPGVNVETAYLRVWHDEALIVCPILLIGDLWYNTPRAEPVLIQGAVDDAWQAIDEATEEYGELIIHRDDSEQLAEIQALEWQLNADADDQRNRQTLIPSDLDDMRFRLRFADDLTSELWFEAVQWLGRSGLDARFVEYRRNDEPIGWGIYAAHLGELTCLAAAHVEFEVPTWVSQR